MNFSSGSVSSKYQFEYQEKMILLHPSKQQFSIGIPKENIKFEKRIPLTPLTVKFLTGNGIKVFIEKEAGMASGFTDLEYSESGAEIVDEPAIVFTADIIIKIAPPSFSQIKLFKKNQVLISSINLRTLEKSFFQELITKKITAIAIEYIKDEIGNFSFVKLMSEISGIVAVNLASDFLREKRGKLLAGIAGNKPSEIIVIGAGQLAESVVRSAIEQGALVKVFDNSISRIRQLEQNIGKKVYSSVLYASILKKEFSRADVVIGAISYSDSKQAFLISEELITLMKKSSLVIDLSIDQGSCFEKSKITDFSKPTYEINGVTHFGVPNIPSTVPRTSSYVLGNIFLQQFSNLQNFENFNQFIKNDSNFRNGLYLYNGILVNKHISEIFDLPFQDINLILAAF